MAYAIGTDKKDGTVQPRSTGTDNKQTVQKDIRTETKASPIKTTSTGTSDADWNKSATPNTRVGSDKKETAPAESRFSYIGHTSSAGTSAKDADWNKSATPNTQQRTTVTPGGIDAGARPAGGLNSDKFYQRVADNNGVVPFEGAVDWGGIYDYLQAPADRRMAEVTVRGGKPDASLYDKVDPETGLSFGMMLDFLNTPEVASSYLAPVASGPELWPPGGPNAGKQMPPLIRTGTSADTSITRAYGPDGVSAPLEAIDAIEVPDIQYPSITQSADAGDLFETDGRAVTPEGVVLNPGGPAVAAPVSTGIDAAAPAKEPSTWDNVVDNTGKLLSHSGLGAIVSTLFPDLWSGGGDLMKGLFDGERGTATANGDFTRWDPREGVSMGGGSSFSRDASGYVDTTPSRLPPGKNVPPGGAFPDLNHNGIDDRLEGYTGPDTQPPIPPPAAYGRTAQFPDMPPYNPGRDDEWLYFLNNHLADGGMVEAPTYADGGAIDQSDPRVQLIGQTEDVLERLKAGEKPDEAAARTLKAFVAQFGDAALKSLHDNVGEGMSMKSGRLIKGPGGPKDDAVPAVIVEEGSTVSPAKLSNNEFVMPVSAVEGIGEGDVEIGAQRMQELADRLSQKA